MSSPYSVSPASQNSLQPSPPPSSISDLSLPLFQGKGWIKFVGVMSIISGAFMCISIIYLILGWLPIWLGVLLLQAAGAIERAQQNNDAAALKEGLSKLKKYFVVMGVTYLVSIVLSVLFFVLYFAFFATLVASLSQHAGQ